MTYNPNIPQANDRIADSQPVILQNFQSLNTVYGTDHYPYDDTSPNATKHKHVTLPDQVVSPGVPPTPAASNGAMYARTNIQTWGYWRRDGTITDYPVTPIRCMGIFVMGNGVRPAVGTPLNVTTCTEVSGNPVLAAQIYTIVMPNALPDVNYYVFAGIQSGLATPKFYALNYNILNVNTFSVLTAPITTTANNPPVNISFYVMHYLP